MKVRIVDAYFILPTKNDFTIRFGNLDIVDGKIRSFSESPDRVINARNAIVMPAFVNFHHHIYSTLAKGLPIAKPITNFISTLENLWWLLDQSLEADAVLLSTWETITQSIKNGVTTIFDHHISAFGIPNIVRKMGDIFVENNIDGSICFELTDRYGEDFFAYAMNETQHQHPNLIPMIGCHASFTLSDKSLQKIADTIPKYPLHIHFKEDKYDQKMTIKKKNKHILARLQEYDLLREKSLFVHGNVANEKDFKTLSEKQCSIVRCPDSMMNNSLQNNTESFMENYNNILPGTDGMHSNPLRSIKNQFLLQHFQTNNPATGFALAKTMFLQMYQQKKNYGLDVGLFENETADFVIIDYQPLSSFTNETLLSHLIYGVTEQPVRVVMKGDKILLEDTISTVKNPFSSTEKKKITQHLHSNFARISKNKMK